MGSFITILRGHTWASIFPDLETYQFSVRKGALISRQIPYLHMFFFLDESYVARWAFGYRTVASFGTVPPRWALRTRGFPPPSVSPGSFDVSLLYLWGKSSSPRNAYRPIVKSDKKQTPYHLPIQRNAKRWAAHVASFYARTRPPIGAKYVLNFRLASVLFFSDTVKILLTIPKFPV